MTNKQVWQEELKIMRECIELKCTDVSTVIVQDKEDLCGIDSKCILNYDWWYEAVKHGQMKTFRIRLIIVLMFDDGDI